MTISAGDSLPKATFLTPTEEGPKPVASDELFSKGRAVVFAMPGAFTGTWHDRAHPLDRQRDGRDQGEGRHHRCRRDRE